MTLELPIPPRNLLLSLFLIYIQRKQNSDALFWYPSEDKFPTAFRKTSSPSTASTSAYLYRHLQRITPFELPAIRIAALEHSPNRARVVQPHLHCLFPPLLLPPDHNLKVLLEPLEELALVDGEFVDLPVRPLDDVRELSAGLAVHRDPLLRVTPPPQHEEPLEDLGAAEVLAPQHGLELGVGEAPAVEE